MYSEIVINEQTTPENLFKEVYETNPLDFANFYAELITNQPEYKDIIDQAWVLSLMTKISFDDFKQQLFLSLNNPTIFDDDFVDFEL